MTSPSDIGTPLVAFDRREGLWLDASGALPRTSVPVDWDAVQAGAVHLELRGLGTLLPLWSVLPLSARDEAFSTLGTNGGVACLLLTEGVKPEGWVRLAAPQALEQVRAADRPVLQKALKDGGQTSIGTVPPWLDPNWWRRALDWADACIENAFGAWPHRITVTKPPWGGSAVLELWARQAGRSESPEQSLFFKASAGEPPEWWVLSDLARLQPDAPVPELLGHDEELGCALMRRHPGRPPQQPDEHAQVVRAMAELQVALGVPAGGRWARCSRRDGRWLAEQASILLGDIPRALVAHGVVERSALRLADCIEAAVQCCAALDATGRPQSLHHEDFRPGNVLLEGRRVCILDWADTVMAHPYFSLLRYLDELQEDGAAVGAVTKAYAAVWCDARGSGSFDAELQVVRKVAVLYEAARHAQHMDVKAWAAAGPGPEERAMAQVVMDRLLRESRSW